jgi:MFS family permease
MLVVEALMFPLYALAPSVLMLGIVAAAESLVAPIYSVALTAYRMAITPDELRGRSASALSMVTVGAMSLGALLSGVLISAAGVYGTVWILSGWLAILAVIALATRAIRDAATDEQPQDVADADGKDLSMYGVED